MKLKLRQLSGNKYNNPRISTEIETRHVVQPMHPVAVFQNNIIPLTNNNLMNTAYITYNKGTEVYEEFWKHHRKSLEKDSKFSNIIEHDNIREWDYAEPVYYLNVETLEDLFKFSSEIDYDLILDSEDYSVTIYDGYNE